MDKKTIKEENSDEKNGESVTDQEDETLDPDEELESVRQEARDNYDRFVRLSAEFENYKKRASREMSEFRKYANETIVRALLPVVDNLERAIESSGDDENATSCVVEGVEMTLKEILKVFEQFEVKPVESLEQPFDPGFHEAMMREESDEYPENTVIKELQKGYLMHERLIRPAMVVVSAAKTE
ncbi:MAG: nucleotide exchange factor GrpE [Deltaproteobacteria bacterium]|nr:nucleotide exchange factor GrpE [Deltaproteobacteria bacterium]